MFILRATDFDLRLTVSFQSPIYYYSEGLAISVETAFDYGLTRS